MVIRTQPKHLVKESIIGRFESHMYHMDIPYSNVKEVMFYSQLSMSTMWYVQLFSILFNGNIFSLIITTHLLGVPPCVAEKPLELVGS